MVSLRVGPGREAPAGGGGLAGAGRSGPSGIEALGLVAEQGAESGHGALLPDAAGSKVSPARGLPVVVERDIGGGEDEGLPAVVVPMAAAPAEMLDEEEATVGQKGEVATFADGGELEGVRHGWVAG